MNSKNKLVNFRAPIFLVQEFDKVILELKVSRTAIFRDLMQRFVEDFKNEYMVKTKQA